VRDHAQAAPSAGYQSFVRHRGIVTISTSFRSTLMSNISSKKIHMKY
jgi:hypothetical protein